MEFKDNYSTEKLVIYNRNGLIEQEHSGFIYSNDFEIGQSFDYPFYLRSCAKPLQGSLIVDYDLDFSLEEIALCCASHTGEIYHTNLAKSMINKLGLKESDLKCGLHKPISEKEKEKLIKYDLKENVFQNNCVGKHIMMLAICLKNGWNIKNYDDINHPLQKIIKEKIYSLCELYNEYPSTKDGCGVPIYSMPLKNILKGFLNLFLDKKYNKIKDAYRIYPKIIGGEGRLDTKIIQNSKNLVAKVGAGGLCAVVNLKEKKGIIVKILDCDMKAREVATLSIIRKLGWADIPFDNDIKTLHGDIVGKIEFCK